jgi:hypothetical protein
VSFTLMYGLSKRAVIGLIYLCIGFAIMIIGVGAVGVSAVR